MLHCVNAASEGGEEQATSIRAWGCGSKALTPRQCRALSTTISFRLWLLRRPTEIHAGIQTCWPMVIFSAVGSLQFVTNLSDVKPTWSLFSPCVIDAVAAAMSLEGCTLSGCREDTIRGMQREQALVPIMLERSGNSLQNSHLLPRQQRKLANWNHGDVLCGDVYKRSPLQHTASAAGVHSSSGSKASFALPAPAQKGSESSNGVGATNRIDILEKKVRDTVKCLFGNINSDEPFATAGLDSASATSFVTMLDRRDSFLELFPGLPNPLLSPAHLFDFPTPRAFMGYLVQFINHSGAEAETQERGRQPSCGVEDSSSITAKSMQQVGLGLCDGLASRGCEAAWLCALTEFDCMPLASWPGSMIGAASWDVKVASFLPMARLQSMGHGCFKVARLPIREPAGNPRQSTVEKRRANYCVQVPVLHFSQKYLLTDASVCLELGRPADGISTACLGYRTARSRVDTRQRDVPAELAVLAVRWERCPRACLRGGAGTPFLCVAE